MEFPRRCSLDSGLENLACENPGCEMLEIFEATSSPPVTLHNLRQKYGNYMHRFSIPARWTTA